jgi:Cytochrome P460
MIMKIDRKAIVASLLLLALVFVALRLKSSQAREEAATPLPLTGATTAPSLEDLSDYKTWTRVHTTPLPLPAPLDMLCRMPTGKDKIDTSLNPHRRKYFTVYVNDAGRGAMMTQVKPSFPEGSIIVKEKLLFKEDTMPELLTVMVKREKGFNRENGDWEYMVVNGERTKIEGRGKLENCQACHMLKGETDYVFRSYLPDELRQKLR